MKNTQQSLIAGLMIFACVASSQSTISTSGGDVTGSGGNVAFSLGQVMYQTYSNNEYSWSQGVQQAFEISTLDVITPNFKEIIRAYPNPTTSKITLEFKDSKEQKWSYHLVGLQGRRLQSGSIKNTQTSINMDHLLPATYLLVIQDQEHKSFKTFKIIKR